MTTKRKQSFEATFEATYSRYEFAPLVRLVLALGDWIVRLRAKGAVQGRRMSAQSA
jgi:hypothetical protein